jgi:hypothetical protein
MKYNTFEEFLIDHGTSYERVRYLFGERVVRIYLNENPPSFQNYIERLLENNKLEELFEGCFVWTENSGGFDFWIGVNNDWAKFCKSEIHKIQLDEFFELPTLLNFYKKVKQRVTGEYDFSEEIL